MADHSSDGSVIHSIVSCHIKEWGLQDGSRKYDLVHDRVVVCIDRLWSHMPLVSINRRAKLFQFFLGFKSRRCQNVDGKNGRLNLQRRVVFPFVGISDLGGKHGKFFQCLLLSSLSHPVTSGDALGECFLEVLNQFVHSFLGSRLEILFNV